MREQILYNLRNKLKNVFPSFTHIIGVKETIKQSDYPFISYVYTGEEPKGDNESVLKIHLYFGVLEKEFDGTSQEYKGHTNIIQVIEGIKTALYYSRIFSPYVIDSQIERIATDGGLQHPKYEGEIILSVRIFDKIPQEEPVATLIRVEDPQGNKQSEVSL